MRGMMTVVCMTAALVAVGQFGKIPTAFNRWVVARAFLDGCATALFVTALVRINLADLISIVLASPLILTALSVFLFKEVVGWRRWSAIVVGFVGTLFIVKTGARIVRRLGIAGTGRRLCVGDARPRSRTGSIRKFRRSPSESPAASP